MLIDESVLGWGEFELEVMRDGADNVVIVCSIENVDPMGVHTGDSVTVAPQQTLTDRQYQKLRDQAIAVIRAVGVETGGSNVQFAVNPATDEIVVIEMNPRVSRSSALASKATGFPIAKIAARLAVGYRLDEIPNDITRRTPASFEPTIDYVVVKWPRFAFEKFPGVEEGLSTHMKSVGEAMAIGRTFQQAFAKAMRSRELDLDGDRQRRPARAPRDPGRRPLRPRARGLPPRRERGRRARAHRRSTRGSCASCSELALDPEGPFRGVRSFRAVDTCAAEFEAETPYYYSAWERAASDEVRRGDKPSVMILGSGPNRIGQGIEFDYCCVHAAMTVRESGRDAVMVNCNPETVSTDYDTSDRLYFEPLTLEDVLAIVEVEHPEGVIVQFGGQTPLRLAAGLEAAGVPLLGTSPEAIDLAEDRGRFGALLGRLGLKAPAYATAHSEEEALAVAPRVGFPLLVRPSYVLGGRAMEIVYSLAGLEDYLLRVARGAHDRTIYLDRFLENAVEVDVDAICDGEEVWIGGVMQHVEEAGVHSGDSACVLPPHSLGAEMRAEIKAATEQLALALGVVGLMNVQYAVLGDDLYVIEANPRASRTVPFVSKATGIPLAKVACRVMLGEKLAAMDLPADPGGDHVSVKEAVLPFDRFAGSDSLLGPEMRSTGEVMGVAADFPAAFAKAQAAAGARLPSGGTVFLTVTDSDKAGAVGIAAQLHDLGFAIVATRGTRRRDLAHGHPGAAAQQDRRGLAARRRLDRARRRRPRHQHPDRHRRAHGRLRDPRGGDRPRHPLHHDALGRHGRGARDRRRAPRRARGRLAPGPPRARLARRAAGVSDRTLAPLGRRLCPVVAHARHGAYDVLTVLDARARRRSPGQFYMLAASERWGGGADERPFLPRAFSVLRRHEDGTLDFLLEDVGPGTRRLCELRAGDGLWLLGPLGDRLPPARRTAGGRCSSAAASGSRRWRSGRTRSPDARVLLGFRDAAHAEGAALLRDARVATDDGSVGYHGLVTDLLREELDDVVHGLRLRAAADARGGARAVRGRGRAGPARARVGDGVRVRRVLRLRRADARRLRAAVRRRAGARRRRAGAGGVSDAADVRQPLGGVRDLCGIELAHPVINASGTFDAIAARRAFGDALLARFPFAAFVSKTVTLEPRAGQPAAAAVGARRRHDQLDRPARTRAWPATSSTTCRSSPSCRCR